jgi:hypothetical protein
VRNLSEVEVACLLGQWASARSEGTAADYWRLAQKYRAGGRRAAAAFCAGCAYGLVAWCHQPTPVENLGDAVLEFIRGLDKEEVCLCG